MKYKAKDKEQEKEVTNSGDLSQSKAKTAEIVEGDDLEKDIKEVYQGS